MITGQIYQGDCREVLKQLPEGSIAACITDPPYNYEFIGRDWDDQEVRRRLDRIQESNTLVKNIPYGSGLAGGVRNARWYQRNRENALAYQNWCLEWGRELNRVCKAGAMIAVFSSTRSFAHVQVALESAGFYARDCLVFRRHSGIPKGLNFAKKLAKEGAPNAEMWEGWHSCLRNEWEAIALLQKPLLNNYLQTIEKTGVGLLRAVNEDGSFQSNIFEGFTNRGTDMSDEHCTVKPIELIKKLIRLLVPPSPDNIVLDPFAGTGTTLIAARDLGFQYVGIEVEPRYVSIIKDRLETENGNSHDSPRTGQPQAVLF